MKCMNSYFTNVKKVRYASCGDNFAKVKLVDAYLPFLLPHKNFNDLFYILPLCSNDASKCYVLSVLNKMIITGWIF